MSRATKRKHVMNEALQDYFTPPTDGQEIVRVIASRGNNLHEVETLTHSTYLVSMPSKFRKNIWVKRGDFVIVEPIEEGDKVKAEMVRVLSKEHIKYFKKIKAWPEGFDAETDSDDEFDNSNWTGNAQTESDSTDSSVSESLVESESNSSNEKSSEEKGKEKVETGT